MSTLADVFIADDAFALRYDGGETWNEGEGFSAKSLNNLHFEILAAIFDGVEEVKEFEEIRGEEDGPWAHRFPSPLTERLAAASLEELASVAAEWADTEEMAADPEDAVALLEELQTLARKAVASGRAIYLWVSL